MIFPNYCSTILCLLRSRMSRLWLHWDVGLHRLNLAIPRTDPNRMCRDRIPSAYSSTFVRAGDWSFARACSAIRWYPRELPRENHIKFNMGGASVAEILVSTAMRRNTARATPAETAVCRSTDAFYRWRRSYQTLTTSEHLIAGT